jgi:hypothetical protein
MGCIWPKKILERVLQNTEIDKYESLVLTFFPTQEWF